MIDLYFWTTPNGYKPLLFLEEAGIDYEIRPINISTGEQFQPEFLKISPNNRIPAIVDHDPEDGGAPLEQFESGAILQYLAEKTGKFFPADARGRAEVLQWLNWQMGGIGPMFGQYLHFVDYAPVDLPYAKDRYTREAERLLDVLDKRLADRKYVAGEYSIADMAIYPWVRQRIERFEGFANVERWARAVADRPATTRAFEKGAAINTVPTINKKSKALLLGLTSGIVDDTKDHQAT
ncbi:MAG: glutathione S-transferase N-terminal domain-containing protein [Sneathiella sp.]|nr:glutathione S-transferase N-terminal domain-containing protein [Sneathiella sp.]